VIFTIMVLAFLGGKVAQQTTPPPPAASSAANAASSTQTFTFTSNPRKAGMTYPWKTNIVTTVFRTGKVRTAERAWSTGWTRSEDETGFIRNQNGLLFNPFRVALPFNDLEFPDKARRWLPVEWQQPPNDGRPFSACQHRWVEIKNAKGLICYAQWEDVGPLRHEHAEYVFGNERPSSGTSPGLEVSPAVARYLGLGDKKGVTSWRFVDDVDIPPGAWLKYDESDGLFFVPMQQSQTSSAPSGPPQ
jgi:hypothetical protein